MSDLIDRSKLPTIRITIPTRGYTELAKHIVEIVAEGFQTMIESAPDVDAVPRDEYDALLKRFQHLLKSDFIRSFDEYDPRTGTYKRDITEADNVVSIVCCAKCRHWIKNSTASGTFKRCALIGSNTSRGFYCANGVRKDDKNE